MSEVGGFTPIASYQRFAYACGALLLLSGLVHLGVYAVDGGPWEGPLSWRKPIVFGLSFGITLVTVAWLMTFMRVKRVTGWIVVGLFAVASLAEVSLVSLQTWRGVASHFNETTQFDSSVFSFMGMLVALLVVLTVYVTSLVVLPDGRAAVTRLGDSPRSAADGGQPGGRRTDDRRGRQHVRRSRVLKVPHAVTLHAVQVLPALAILLLVARSNERRRLRIVALGAVGYAVLIASTLVQTYDGRGPLDLSPLTSTLALLGIATLAIAGLLALRGILSQSLVTPETR